MDKNTKRTCGQCGHWSRASNVKRDTHGMCCKDVPFWVHRAEDDPRWFVMEYEEGAENCDCFSKKE